MTTQRFTRTGSDCSETLSLVRFTDGPMAGTLAVQITTGPELGDDFVGLYDLDGDRIDCGNVHWQLADDVSSERGEEIALGWQTEDYAVERLAD